MANAIAWTEIPATDLEKARVFYGKILQADLAISEMGPNPAVFLPGSDGSSVSGHLYPGKPAAAGTGNTIHFSAVGPLEDTMNRIKEAGGSVESPVIEIPSGKFFYAVDPDGNSIGFFEAK
jgi:predicted enzyme related to lactoylglutathione lyase